MGNGEIRVISIPKNDQNVDGCEEEKIEECVSGDNLTTVNNPEGCKVKIIGSFFICFNFPFFPR